MVTMLSWRRDDAHTTGDRDHTCGDRAHFHVVNMLIQQVTMLTNVVTHAHECACA